MCYSLFAFEIYNNSDWISIPAYIYYSLHAVAIPVYTFSKRSWFLWGLTSIIKKIVLQEINREVFVGDNNAAMIFKIGSILVQSYIIIVSDVIQ